MAQTIKNVNGIATEVYRNRGSHIDYLICSVAHNNNFLIFTLDKDFEQYRKYIDIELVNDIGGRFPSAYPNTERC